MYSYEQQTRKKKKKMKYSKEEIKYIKEEIIDKLLTSINVKISEKERVKHAKILLEFCDEYYTFVNGRPVPKCKFKLNEKLKQINKDVGFEMNEVF